MRNGVALTIEDEEVVEIHNDNYWALLKNPVVLGVTMVYGVQSLIQIGYDTLYSIWLSSSRSSGGLALDKEVLGIVVAFASPFQISTCLNLCHVSGSSPLSHLHSLRVAYARICDYARAAGGLLFRVSLHLQTAGDERLLAVLRPLLAICDMLHRPHHRLQRDLRAHRQLLVSGVSSEDVQFGFCDGRDRAFHCRREK